ncbi:uncharacterized protein LOC122536725, partial [Frieseomelitta varia]|uniref:uncharacterized protein LOC122536725 n=1 Tax=Frieseomelitta varia TaxID=561572 RepID=UPI001CB68123
MHFQNFFYLQLIVALYADKTNMIRDYFVFKDVTRVAGFSCGEIENDYQVVKLLNDVGIMVSINHFTSTIDVFRFLRTTYWNLGIFLDLRCSVADENIMKIFYETSTHYMYDHLHQWLILGNNMSHTVQLLNDSVFSIITDITIAIPNNNDYFLYDVYNHCKSCGGLINITELGTWTGQNGLQITLQTDKFPRRWDYHKMRIKIAGLTTGRHKDQSLIEYLREQSITYTDNWSKFGFAIMEHVKDLFNFTFEVIELDHWEKNDSVGPLISGLHQGKYHLGYFPSIITIERLNRADVILQVWPIRTCFMFLTKPSLKVDMNIIFRPFSRNVWYVIFLLIIIIIFVLWMILKLETHVADYGITVLITVAALCQQGLPFISTQFSSRVVFLHTLIFGLLVYNYYSAAIVSSRLNVPLDKMNDSLYSLVKSKMKLAAYKDIYFNYLLRYPADDVQYFAKYWNTIPEDKRFLSLEDGVKGISNLRFAYHAEPTNVYPLIDRSFDKEMICQLTEVHLFRPNSIGLWSAQRSPFQEITKIGLIRIYTSGIRKREVLRWSYRKPYCNKDKHYVSSVTIHEMIPIILVLCFGIVLSAVICFMENVVFHIRHKKQEQTKESENRLKKCNQKNIVPQIKTMVKTKKLLTT